MGYNDELKTININLDNIYLDPNNPRFSDNKILVPENKIIEDKVQKKTFEKMLDFDIDSLIKNIELNWFLKIDRIIVRKIKWTEKDKYVVIEWNRRISALKTIKKDNYNDEILKSIEEIEVLLYEWDSESITWFLQWIRHISWIKEWTPYQQAVLLEKTISDEKISITKAWEKYWLWRQISARLLRTLKALNNFKEDDEYWEYAKNNHFSIFEEILKKPVLKEYFGWNDSEQKFKNENNIKMFYDWIQKWIISSAVDDVRKKLPIVLKEDTIKLDSITEWEKSLDEVYIDALSNSKILSPEELDEKFLYIEKELDNIPFKAFSDKEQKKKLSKNLKLLKEKIIILEGYVNK